MLHQDIYEEVPSDLETLSTDGFYYFEGNNFTTDSERTAAHSRHSNYSVSLTVYEYLLMFLGPRRQDLGKAISITIIYVIIFVTGIVGNVMTCVVIATKR